MYGYRTVISNAGFDLVFDRSQKSNNTAPSSRELQYIIAQRIGQTVTD